ncbi:MAG: SpoIID/LytB domain-containing protein, partial [Lacipirellulaceae bacterium]
MRVFLIPVALLLLALGDVGRVHGQGEFNALPTINVTGSGNVPTESDYVPSVIQCENGLASFEALKAQAVAARTYAYFQIDKKGVINDGTIDQVYSCAGSPGSIHHQAAQATEGEILWVRDNDNNGTPRDVLVAAFYVARAIPSGPFNVNN